MIQLLNKFKHRALFPDHFSRSLILGYLTLFFIISLSIIVFLKYSERLQQTLQQSETLYQSVLLVDKHISLARERSITLTKMFETDDPFEIDQLQQKMTQLEHEIGTVRRQIKRLLKDPKRLQFFNQTPKLLQQNKQQQYQVYRLLMDEHPQAAIKVLINQTFETQAKVIQALTHLKNDLLKNYNQLKEETDRLIALMDKLALLAGLVPIAILFIIAYFTVRKIQFHEQKQRRFQKELEKMVQKRTKELQLDAAIFEHIHEAIALTKLDGTIIKSNPPFLKLFLLHQQGQTNAHQPSLWQLLSKLFEDIHIGQIQTDIEQTSEWTQEVKLKAHPHYYQLTLSRLRSLADNSEILSVVLSDVSQLKATQQKLENIAKTDTVTQLKNRFAFNEDLHQQLLKYPNTPLCLMMLDLDHFKAINDHFGHEEGDRLLKLMGEILQQTAHQQGLKADHYRIGGDEFVVCLQQKISDTEISAFCNHILGKANHFSKNWNKLGFGCSIGVVRYPDDARHAEELLRFADFAMYEAKKKGRNDFQIFNETLRQNIDYIAKMRQQMEKAIKNKAFKVYFQPQVKLHNLELCGAEALLRWPTDQGMISPAEFIPLAEKFDLIDKLGSFVLKESIAIFCKWQSHCEVLPRISINVSAKQISSQTLGPALQSALKTYPIHPKQLDFEITESVLMDYKNLENNCLKYIEQLGSEISIDDFGTGYSSLAYIQNLNADRIKIDRSFVLHMQKHNASYNIVKAIIEMAHSLGLKVLAEGIETFEHYELLKELGCDEGQGFYFSRPLSEEAFFKQYIQSNSKNVIM
ncbi:putative bifunctional diguanylate cyclase/phosphodiesterase [Galenea microaerophila]